MTMIRRSHALSLHCRYDISYTLCIEHKYYLATQDVQGHISSKLSSSVEVKTYHLAQCSSDITAAHPAPVLFDQS